MVLLSKSVFLELATTYSPGLDSSNHPNDGQKEYDAESVSYNIFSYHGRLLFQWICNAIVCQSIDLFGTFSNIINIICFVKQGFNDPVNISLLGLAVSDLGCVVTLIFLNLCHTPAFRESDLPFDAFEFQYLTSGWPHVVFSRITSWITALVTLERCLCITMPLKVKTIVTSRRVSIAVVCIFTTFICSVSPVYCVNSLGLKFFPIKNKTLLGLVSTGNRESIERVSFAINNIFAPFVGFAVVFVSTVILIVKLQEKTKWRQRAVKWNRSDETSKRDRKIAKMVMTISTLFIVCFIPSCIFFVAMILEPGFAIDGKHQDVFLIAFSFGFILESTNSAGNIFIYYRMSSRYRAVFRHIFCLRKED